ncbi:MAG: dihydrofolate reductase [Xanthomonadales bacterium]|nr:dihydrofolate reductase [Xanthomonadales bacterium]
MTASPLTMIVAMDRNRAIGFDGQMPWHLPADLGHFKQATMGTALVMGRKTYAAIGRPLPGRRNIVITRNPGFQADGCDTAGDLEQALTLAGDSAVMIIGGGEIYALAMPLARRLLVSHVDTEAPRADAWFPPIDQDRWRPVGARHYPADRANPLDFTVVEYLAHELVQDKLVICRSPHDPERVERIACWRYDAIRAAILQALPADGHNLTLTGLMQELRQSIGRGEQRRLGSFKWLVTTVKLEMEVNGELLRADGDGPQRLYRAAT